MPEPTQKSNRSWILAAFRAVLMPVCWAFCLALVALVAAAGYRWSRDVPQDGAATASAASPDLNKDLNKEVDDHIDRRIRSDQALVDKLVVLVGIYTTILSFLALGTVLLNRQDAKEQIENARRKIEELQQTIERDFPEIGRLHESIQNLMQELEGILPDEKNWRESSYVELSGGEREDILTKEFTIAALGVFAPRQSIEGRKSLSRIFVALSRFYLGKFVAEKSPADAERANLYVTRSIGLDPRLSVAYRQRGSIFINQFAVEHSVPDPANPVQPATQLNEKEKLLLRKAEEDFKMCQQNDSVDAGSYFNLALLWYYRGNLKNAIDVSKELLRIKDAISWNHRQKYLPDIYINLAGFYARQAEQVPTAEAARLRTLAIETCKDAYEELCRPESTDSSLGDFLKSLELGLQKTGDFGNFEVENKKPLFALLERKDERPGARPTALQRLGNWWRNLYH